MTRMRHGRQIRAAGQVNETFSLSDSIAQFIASPSHTRKPEGAVKCATFTETSSHTYLGCSHVSAAERPSLLNKLRHHVHGIATVTVRETISAFIALRVSRWKLLSAFSLDCCPTQFCL